MYWRRLYARGALAPSRDMQSEAGSRELAHREAFAELVAFTERFETYEVELSTELLELGNRLVGRYRLRPHDAALAALSQLTGIPDLITLDRDFRRVDGLVVWSP
jgi:predicted nucleic acid-binding protein